MTSRKILRSQPSTVQDAVSGMSISIRLPQHEQQGEGIRNDVVRPPSNGVGRARACCMTQTINWTNESVLRFAGQADPVAKVEETARACVLKALDAGWSGPPFNPLFLADQLRIPVEANSQVRDARAVPDNGGVRIQFNPTQPRERVRFSIAHEVAHALFPDVTEAVRNRGGDRGPDDWQLEMLCNIAAAEFIMPVGSMALREHAPPIETLMAERRKFDVSAEAFLIRVAKVVSEPLLVAFASPRDGGGRRYRVDYAVPSRGWELEYGGLVPPADTLMAECTAIGHTSHGTESWQPFGDVNLQCVGIPGYPGSSLPRVACIIRPCRPVPHDARHLLQHVHGDVLWPQGGGPRIVCMMVNDAARRWGGGIARGAATRFPGAEAAFGEWLSDLPRDQRLGLVHFAPSSGGVVLASLVAQHGYGPSEKPRIRYAALGRCLDSVGDEALANGASVHMPRLGTGGAGGDWQVVEQMVNDSLVARGVTTIVYEPPPRRAGAEADLFA